MDINSYRLTSLEEPPEEFLAQIMREAAEDAAKENKETMDKFFENMSREYSKLEAEWKQRIENLS